MLLLSFYFYFIKNAYLGFISSFYPLHQFQALFIGKTSFQQLLIAWKRSFQETCVLHFPDTCVQRGQGSWLLGLSCQVLMSTLSVNDLGCSLTVRSRWVNWGGSGWGKRSFIYLSRWSSSHIFSVETLSTSDMKVTTLFPTFLSVQFS